MFFLDDWILSETFMSIIKFSKSLYVILTTILLCAATPFFNKGESHNNFCMRCVIMTLAGWGVRLFLIMF